MTWGGARNLTVSYRLNAKQVSGIMEASEAAIAAGRPFNRFITVHWTALGVPDAKAARATGRLIKLASDWCSTKRVKMTWAWVRENDFGDRSKGSHVHMLLHCPNPPGPSPRAWAPWRVAQSDRLYKPTRLIRRFTG